MLVSCAWWCVTVLETLASQPGLDRLHGDESRHGPWKRCVEDDSEDTRRWFAVKLLPLRGEPCPSAWSSATRARVPVTVVVLSPPAIPRDTATASERAAQPSTDPGPVTRYGRPSTTFHRSGLLCGDSKQVRAAFFSTQILFSSGIQGQRVVLDPLGRSVDCFGLDLHPCGGLKAPGIMCPG